MSKKKIAISLICLLFIGGASVGIFALVNISEDPPVVVQQLDNPEPVESEEVTDPVTEVVAEAEFVGGDSVHKASGSAKIIKENGQTLLAFDDGFKVLDGPDLFVYLSPNEAGEELGEFASLGEIKSHIGSQTYTLPDNYGSYKTVVIWCRAFSVTFATAQIL